MSRTHVLRIPRSDSDGGSSFVLIHVTPSSSKTARPLDVKVVATEGDYPYAVSLHHSKVAQLKAPDSLCSTEEWEHILQSVLLERESLDNIQLTAAVLRSGLEITVRKKFQRITQRLGAITLSKNEDEDDSDIAEWCSIAIESREKLRGELAAAEARAKDLERAVDVLKDQLQELISVKHDHETVLLDRFRALLNQKKAKIREQETLIRRVKLHEASTVSTQSSPRVSPGAADVPLASRRSKRKAPTDHASESGESGDGFDTVMDLDAVQGYISHVDDNGALTEEEERTTGGDADTAASEPDDESAMVKVKKKEHENDTARTDKQTSPTQHTVSLATSRRRLADTATSRAPTLSDSGSETESDDEL